MQAYFYYYFVKLCDFIFLASLHFRCSTNKTKVRVLILLDECGRSFTFLGCPPWLNDSSVEQQERDLFQEEQ